MANKYRDMNVVTPPNNRKYIPVLQYTSSKDEAGNLSYDIKSKGVIPRNIKDGQYGSITLSNGQKLLYFTNEIAGPITWLLLSNGEVYSDAWLLNHVDYVEKNLIDSSNNPLTIIKKLTSDEDIAKVKELIKKLDFDHFLNVKYDNASNSVTLDLNNVTPYQGEDKLQPQKDNNGNWYLPKTDNAYGELGIGYAQPYAYDAATGHNTVLTPDFETVTDDAGLKFVRAKKPAEVYPNAVAGDIYPILPAKRGYTGNHLSYNMVPYDFPATLNGNVEIKEDNIIFTDQENVYMTNNVGDKNTEESVAKQKAQESVNNTADIFNSGSKIFIESTDKNINKFDAGKTIIVYYSPTIYPDVEKLKQTLENKNPLFSVAISTVDFLISTYYVSERGYVSNAYVNKKISAYRTVFTLKEKITTNFSSIYDTQKYIKNNLPKYNKNDKECIYYFNYDGTTQYTYDALNTDKITGWHNVMSYDGSAWTPKDFMSSVTKTYTFASGTATEKTDGVGTFYKFDDTMYPFFNSDIADISCGKNFTVFLLKDGSVWTCGANYRGQLGKGTDADKDILQITPNPIDVGSFTAIAAKEQTWIAIGNNGVLYACGANTFGQMGLGDKQDRSVLTPVADNVERVQLTAGNIIIRKADGTVYGAGYNYDDRLGLNVCKCVTNFTKLTGVE